MGASVGGVAFRLDTAGIDSAKVVYDLFGPGFHPQEGYADTRYKDNVFIAKTKDLLIIHSSDLAEKFFHSTDSAAVQTYLDYFGKPSFVFAYEEYDSGGTYSYSLIIDGQVRRQYQMVSGEETINFGEPDPIELRWLNLPTETEEVDGENTELVYVDVQTKHRYYKEHLPSLILSALMKEKLGFTSWDMGEHFVGEQLFKRVSSPASGAAKKPWWKFW